MLITTLGDASFGSPTTSVCETHLRWPGHSGILSRRQDVPPFASSSSAPSSTTSTSADTDGNLGKKMDVMIGLITVLIVVVVVIILIAVFYALRLRNKERLRRLERDPEGEGKGSKSNLLLVSSKSESRTAVSNTEPTFQERQSGGKVGLSSEGYLKGRETTDFTSSSFSTGAQADSTKQTTNRLANIDTNTIASPRLYGVQPPSSPPKEPIPALPDSPVVPSHTPLRLKGNGDEFLPRPSPASSSIQSRARQTGYSRSQPSPIEGPQRSQGIRYSKGAFDPYKQRHLRDGSGSNSSPTSNENRFPRRARPVSKQLPPPPLHFIPEPLSGAAIIDSPTRTRPPADRAQHADRSSWSNSGTRKQASSKLVPIVMQPIRESSTSFNVDPNSPERVNVDANVNHARTRSAEDVQPKARLRNPVLRGSRSSPEFEHFHPSNDVRLGVATQSSGLRSDTVLRQNPHRTSSFHKDGDGVLSRVQQVKLNLEISTGLESGDLSAPSHEIIQPPSAGAENVPFEIARATRIQVGSQRTREGTSAPGARNSPYVRVPIRRDRRPALPQPPSYDQTLLPVSLPTIAPLSPRRRALPKPPT